ncbi:MAG: hypothetical protein B6I18_05885 [Bacteroidetes bacterium 4572_112]|nr:MAG: hypothetical protein B6I18_05885 [Bacteroidetes bacterium 4572_112]
MENITLGILTKSYVISRGIQFIISKNSGLSINIIPSSENDIDQFIADNKINMLIISDSLYNSKSITKLYKTHNDLYFGIVRCNDIAINSMIDLKLDININDSEDIINKKVSDFINTTTSANRLSIENSELSKREIEILRMVALGHTNQVIAELLFISKHTVVTHRYY